MKKIIFLLIIISIPLTIISGQYKYEREYRLDKNKVPPSALEFVDALNFSKKIKWYKEEGLQTSSVEAKTKHQSKKYSIEFDLNGKLEDIEITMGWESVPIETRQPIVQYFNDHFQKHKICKTQIQLTGEKEILINTISNPSMERNEEVRIHYEIVAKVKHNGKHQKMEFLFSEIGEMKKQSIILQKNTDNLEY